MPDGHETPAIAGRLCRGATMVGLIMALASLFVSGDRFLTGASPALASAGLIVGLVGALADELVSGAEPEHQREGTD